MRKLIMILTMVFIGAGLSNCGLAQGLTEFCGGDLDHLCDFVLGEDPSETQDQIDDIDDRLIEIEDRVTVIENAPEVTIDTCTVMGSTVLCPDGTKITIPEPVEDEDEVTLKVVGVNKNSCTKVADGLYVENIQSGKFFDVYKNNKCKDSLGEHCDNVETAFGSSGTFGQGGAGAARVCWVDNTQISGTRSSNGNILLRMVQFN